MDNKLIYDRNIAETFEQLSPEHRKVMEWVGSGKKILEIGCHTGYVSAWFKKLGNDVTGVEIHSMALEKAKPYLVKYILGNIEEEHTWSEIAKDRFDVVTYMHVLEHLVNPYEILKKTKYLLKENGFVIICLPNISNWVDRWKMFRGRFEYEDWGVMDRTHLRFFNYYTAQDLIHNAGFKILEYSDVGWKVHFRPFPEISGIGRLNILVQRIINKTCSPNLTDKVLMFKAGI